MSGDASAILGWKIDPDDRDRLLRRFPPSYGETVADHVTFGRRDKTSAVPQVDCATVVGRADDGEGVEALVVELAGSTDRWDGSTYHITWSLAEGREPVESNAVIARCGWRETDPEQVGLIRADWP
ncbi:MAG: hypothetical protein ACR2FJ_08200 [Qipengyuania sp.]